jgi:hypothetical protein
MINGLASGSPTGGPYDGDFVSAREGAAGSVGKPVYAAVTARSFHPTSVNAMYMDGSVHSVNDSIDRSMWQAMCGRTDAVTVEMPE